MAWLRLIPYHVIIAHAEDDVQADLRNQKLRMKMKMKSDNLSYSREAGRRNETK